MSGETRYWKVWLLVSSGASETPLGARRPSSCCTADCSRPPQNRPSDNAHALRQLGYGRLVGKCEQRGTGTVILHRRRPGESRLHWFSLAKRFRRQHHLRAQQLHVGVVRGQRGRADVRDRDARVERQCRHLGARHRHLFTRFTSLARPELSVLRRGQW